MILSIPKRSSIIFPIKNVRGNRHLDRVISLLDVISKLVERTAAHLIADHMERRKGRGLHDGQFGCRKRLSCIDAVAIMVNRTQQVLGETKWQWRVHGRQVSV